jgi:ParB/RepB/Spo0J family partition protein
MATPSKAELSEEPTEQAHSYRVLETIILDPLQIEIDESHNGRFAAPSADRIARMAKSLIENGQKQPVQVLQPNGNGKYPLYIGFTRTKAALKAGLKLRAEVVEIGETDRLFGNMAENMDRTPLGTMDHANNVARLIVARLKNVEIAKRLGKSPAWVSKMDAISQLPGPYHRAVQAELITMDEAYELSKISDEANRQKRFAQMTAAPKAKTRKPAKREKRAWKSCAMSPPVCGVRRKSPSHSDSVNYWPCNWSTSVPRAPVKSLPVGKRKRST